MSIETKLEPLRLAVHGVSSPFSCGGTVVPDKPLKLRFSDKSSIRVTRAEDRYKQSGSLKDLIARCEPATIGDKRRNRYDRQVRDALQLKAENGGFCVSFSSVV